MVAPATAPFTDIAPPTGSMRSYRPGSAVARYVRGGTGYRMEAGPASTHQGVPSAHLTLLLCLDGTVQMLAHPDRARPPGTFAALVGGLHDRPAVIAQGAAQTGVQLELTWRGARALLGVPAGELAGDVVDLEALLGGRTAALSERMAEASGWTERFAVLDAELTVLLAAGPGDRGIAPEVGYAWDRLEETGGLLRITDLASEVGWSRRHLGDRFRREIGLGPKAAARVIRFERACDRLRSPARPALARVAADSGYVDQAHLARDFRELAGITATAWFAERPAG